MSRVRWGAASLALALALVLAQCVQLCSAQLDESGGCGFDTTERNSGPLPVTVSRKASKRSRGAFQVQPMSDDTQWAPIRIVTHLQTPDRDAVMCKDKNENQNVTNAFGQTVPCVKDHAEWPFPFWTFGQILEGAVKLHTDRLLVEPTQDPIVVPDLTNVNTCNKFTIPSNYYNEGAPNADFFLLAVPTPLKRTAPFVHHTCATNEKGRPTVGVVAFDMQSFMEFRYHRASTRFLAHAIAHTLGFSQDIMQAKGMIETRTIRGQSNTPIMTSPKVKEAARKHYGCNTLEGMEMLNKEGLKNHWNRRTALDELMSLPLPRPGDSFLGLYTELTLSAFEDLGFYKARFDLAEPMRWGKNAGCEFMEHVCKDSTENRFPAMFCDPSAETDVYKCSSDRVSFGVCSANAGTSVDTLWTEFCPIVKAQMRCDVYPKVHIPGHTFGGLSWCLDAEALTLANSSAGDAVILDGVCAELICDRGNVLLRYAGGNREFTQCTEGESIPVSSSVYQSGSIKCPKYEEVCIVGAYGNSYAQGKKKQVLNDTS